MFGTLPKLVDKPFVIGFIVPVLIGVLAIIGLLQDVPPFSSVYSSLLDSDSFTKLAVFVLALWACAIGLLLLNYRLYRMLEGYIGPFDRETWRQQMRDKFKKESDELGRIRREAATLSNEDRRDYRATVRRFREKWPSRQNLVLPTRFGNVIRAAETYALEVYGVDSIAVWPRLQALFPKEFQVLVEDARAQVDFFVNSWFLAILFADVAIARSLYPMTVGRLVSVDFLIAMWVLSAIAGLLAWAAYEGAIERAGSWGRLVKSAFDLYLPAFAKQLGYELPSSDAERRRFWRAVNEMFLYQTRLRPEFWIQTAAVNTMNDGKGSTKDGDKPGGGTETETTETTADEITDIISLTNDEHQSEGKSGVREMTPADRVAEFE
jgi:hypothetical protein